MTETIAAAPIAPAAAKEWLRQRALAEGFPLVRFASAATLFEARRVALEREQAGLLADMAWMTPEWLERATEPGRFLDGARSVMVVALPYGRPEREQPARKAPRGRVARYAQGRDYHRVFEKKLRRLTRAVREELDAGARGTVDYGPLLERPLAAVSGLGWQGKSTMLLVPGLGPWVMLGAVATTLEVEPDAPLAKSCGTCTRCIVSCPTGAIAPDGDVVDSRRCISYHTIENRGWIPRELRASFGDWVFGCDACLESCPVGRHAPAGHPDLDPKDVDAARPELVPLLELDEAAFRARFQGRAIMRAKRAGLARNACIALGNIGTEAELRSLVNALDDEAAIVRGHAAWAIGRLAERNVLSAGACSTAASELRRAKDAERDQTCREELESALEIVEAAG